MKSNILAFAVLALAATASAVVQADTLVPVRGRTVDLGAVHGIAYYTVEKSGFRVVATLAEPAIRRSAWRPCLRRGRRWF